MIKLTDLGFVCTKCKQTWYSKFKAHQHECYNEQGYKRKVEHVPY